MELGQKNSTVSGIDTLTVSPPNSISCVNSMSGDISATYFLNATESLANIFCAKLLTISLDLSPSTSVIVYLSLVDTSALYPYFFDCSMSFEE